MISSLLETIKILGFFAAALPDLLGQLHFASYTIVIAQNHLDYGKIGTNTTISTNK